MGQNLSFVQCYGYAAGSGNCYSSLLFAFFLVLLRCWEPSSPSVPLPARWRLRWMDGRAPDNLTMRRCRCEITVPSLSTGASLIPGSPCPGARRHPPSSNSNKHTPPRRPRKPRLVLLWGPSCEAQVRSPRQQCSLAATLWLVSSPCISHIYPTARKKMTWPARK